MRHLALTLLARSLTGAAAASAAADSDCAGVVVLEASPFADEELLGQAQVDEAFGRTFFSPATVWTSVSPGGHLGASPTGVRAAHAIEPIPGRPGRRIQ